MTQDYWIARKNWYMEMISHIKEQRTAADGVERKKLTKELERIYNEIHYIEQECLK